MTAPELDSDISRHVRHALDNMGVPLGTRPIAFPVPAAASAGSLWTGSAIVLGWSVDNTAGVVGGLVLLDGNDVNGQPLARVRLAAGTSDAKWFGPQGVQTRSGLFQTSDAGVAGAVYVIPAVHGR